MQDATLPPNHYENTTGNTPKKPTSAKKHQPDELAPYEQANAVLIPLHEPKAVDRFNRPRGKSPIDNGWRIKNYSGFDARSHMLQGKNVGVRLGATDLVVDYDPRNADVGDDPLERLCEDMGINLEDCFITHTGSGGMHVYLKKPASHKIVGILEKYKGLDFKSEGSQVVAAGSVHPNGKLYTGDILSPELEDTLIAPPSLLALIERAARISTDSCAGECTPEQLQVMLTGLDPLDYRDHSKWLELMMACHHATNGEGFEEFAEWSTCDPMYANHRDIILRRWDSLHTKGVGLITFKSLYKALHDKKRDDLIPRTTAEEDFANEPLDEIKDAVTAACEGWVLIADGPSAVRRKDLKIYERKQFSLLFADPCEEGGTVASAAWNGKLPIRRLESLAYLPGMGEFPDGENGTRYNLWQPSKVKAKPGDVRWFLEHIYYLLPDPSDSELFLDFLSLLVREPHVKIHFAMLLLGAQGTGKSAIGTLMRIIVGENNTSQPDSETLKSRFTHWLEAKQLAVVHEMMMDKRLDVMNSLKQIITEDRVRVERKFMNAYSIENCINLLCFTNHADALRLEDGDRRWCILKSPAKAKSEAYYTSLFTHIYSEDGPAAVKHFLQQREVKLDPKGQAPMTWAKANMRELSMTEAEHYLSDLFENEEHPFNFDLVRFDDVMLAITRALENRAMSCKNPRHAAVKFLKERIGAIQPSHNKKSDGSGLNYRLWITRNHDKWLAMGPTERAEAYKTRNKR